MIAKNFNIKSLIDMAHSPIKNYATPGLTSSLIGMPSDSGCVRLFQCDRDHQEPITPHSHRFDFQCWVLKGTVRNRIWTNNGYLDCSIGDLFLQSSLNYKGECGKYEIENGSVGNWSYTDRVYQAGECYSMRANEIHSIFFSRGSLVLFFEGKTEFESSVILQPYADGEVIPTFKVESWMFKSDAK